MKLLSAEICPFDNFWQLRISILACTQNMSSFCISARSSTNLLLKSARGGALMESVLTKGQYMEKGYIDRANNQGTGLWDLMSCHQVSLCVLYLSKLWLTTFFMIWAPIAQMPALLEAMGSNHIPTELYYKVVLSQFCISRLMFFLLWKKKMATGVYECMWLQWNLSASSRQVFKPHL